MRASSASTSWGEIWTRAGLPRHTRSLITVAMMVALNRPDEFRRVITWVGSFGNFRGADRLPGLIRRTEPRPIRIFMQTGRQDLVNYAGSWYLENPAMAAALELAGNDVKIELNIEAVQQ